jgi:hypothetical protein
MHVKKVMKNIQIIQISDGDNLDFKQLVWNLID